MEIDLENTNKKIITFSFILTGFVSFWITRVLFQSLAVTFGSVGKYWSITGFQHGFPVAVGFLIFCLLQFNKNIQIWSDEVVSETLKVVWPTKKDTTAMTIVCCVMLLISALVLGIFDITSKTLVELILSL